MDKETKKYIDDEIKKLTNEVENVFALVKRDMTNVQKRVKKLED